MTNFGSELAKSSQLAAQSHPWGYKQIVKGMLKGPPPENFWIRGLQVVQPNVFLGHFTPIPIPPAP